MPLDSSSGSITKVGYQAYGENPSLASGTYQYTARRFDAETAGSTAEPSGLYYYRARMYSPTLGRFIQADQIGYKGGENLYAYVSNDPLNLTDPNGFAADSAASSFNAAFTGNETAFNTTMNNITAGDTAQQIGAGVGFAAGYLTRAAAEAASFLVPAGLLGTAAETTAEGTVAGEYSIYDATGGLKGLNTNVTANEFSTNLQANGYTATQTAGTNGSVTVLQNSEGSTWTIYARSSTFDNGAQFVGPNGQFLKYNLGQQGLPLPGN